MKNFIKIASSLIILLSCIISTTVNAQGLINNGAKIVITASLNIYIDGTTGNYTSQSNGIITDNTGSTITLAGNWINNSTNTGFSSNGSTVVLTGSSKTIGGVNSTTFHNLKISNAAGITLGINPGIATVDTVTIQNAATLTVTNSTLQIKGAIVNSGTFDASNGTIEMNGSNAQTIPSGTFQTSLIKDLTINNSAGVTLGGAFGITGVLTLTQRAVDYGWIPYFKIFCFSNGKSGACNRWQYLRQCYRRTLYI